MKHLNISFVLPPIIFICLLFSSACQHSDVAEMAPVNTQLTGSWEVFSYQLSGEEQMGQELLSFSIDFSPEEASSGTSNWKWTNPSGTSNSESNYYTLSADGGAILLSGKEYQMNLVGSELTMFCDDGNGGFCTISAGR